MYTNLLLFFNRLCKHIDYEPNWNSTEYRPKSGKRGKTKRSNLSPFVYTCAYSLLIQISIENRSECITVILPIQTPNRWARRHRHFVANHLHTIRIRECISNLEKLILLM